MSGPVTAEQVVDFASNLMEKKMTGSAIEAYDILGLKDLGELIDNFQPGAPLHIKLDLIRKASTSAGRRDFDPRPYRSAHVLHSYCESRDEFNSIADSINTYGKLREVYPLLDFAMSSDSKLTRADIRNLVENARGATYEQVRDLAKQLRLKGDPIFDQLGIDLDELQKLLINMCEYLAEKINTNSQEFFVRFRNGFTPNEVLDWRKALSGLQTDAVYEKYKEDIRKISQRKPRAEAHDLELIEKLCLDLALLAPSEAGRKRVREEWGSVNLAELSTLLKAVSSDEDREKFLRNQETLKTFLRATGQ